ncbi:hypothetical protein EDM68_05630 [Candidatus Uhrbacteria bacterium]|nr:MAG: hypothetical protein EDM68_05630 [Candidatus Uhrbacteria bacterium]
MPLITLTGSSGVGKTTIMKRLLREIPDARLLRSVTTRERRPSDAEGEYLYVTEADFLLRQERDEFAWDAEFGSARYGTLKSDLRLALASDEPHFAAIVPTIIPALHAFASVEVYATRVRSIYLKSPGADILFRRLTVDRGEPIAAAEAKIKECAEWDKIAFDTTHVGRSVYLFIPDPDDLDVKYRKVRDYVLRPW